MEKEGSRLAKSGMGFGWRKLLSFAALGTALVILLATVLIFKNADPPFVVMFALFSVGGALALRTGKVGVAGAVLASLAAAAFSFFSGAFLIDLLQSPETPELIPVFSGFLLSLSVLISAVILSVRGRGRAFEPSGGAKALGSLVLVAIVGVAAWNTYLLSTFESDAARPGDVEVVTQDFEFRPKTMEARSGTVHVHLTNRDSTLHTFTIESLQVNVSLPPGKSVRTSFSAEPGVYRVICEPHAPDMAGEIQIV